MTQKDEEHQRLTTHESSSYTAPDDDSEAADNGAATQSAASATYGALSSSPSEGTTAPTGAVVEMNGAASNGLGDVYGEEAGSEAGPGGRIGGDGTNGKSGTNGVLSGAVEGVYACARDLKRMYPCVRCIYIWGGDELPVRVRKEVLRYISIFVVCTCSLGAIGGMPLCRVLGCTWCMYVLDLSRPMSDVLFLYVLMVE